MLGWLEHMYGREQSESLRIGMEWNALNQTDDPFADYYDVESALATDARAYGI
jgi:hypothetical protein